MVEIKFSDGTKMYKDMGSEYFPHRKIDSLTNDELLAIYAKEVYDVTGGYQQDQASKGWFDTPQLAYLYSIFGGGSSGIPMAPVIPMIPVLG